MPWYFPEKLSGYSLCVLCRRGRWAQASTETDAFEVITLADWEQLMAFYGEDSTLSDAHPARRYALGHRVPCAQ